MQTEDRFNRFKDAPWFPKEQVEIIVGGAGGIGSWLTLLLTRAGFTPHVYDFDIYESHNMAGQLCRQSDIQKTKVKALQEIVKDFCNEDIFVYPEKYTPSSTTHKFVMAGFDNIEARAVMFHLWKQANAGDATAIYIDGRLNVEQLQIFCVTGDDAESIALYEKEYIFPDGDVADASCTFKQTSHTAAMIASHMTAFFTNHLTNVYAGSKVRIVPFAWEYLCPIDYLEN